MVLGGLDAGAHVLAGELLRRRRTGAGRAGVGGVGGEGQQGRAGAGEGGPGRNEAGEEAKQVSHGKSLTRRGRRAEIDAQGAFVLLPAQPSQHVHAEQRMLEPR